MNVSVHALCKCGHALIIMHRLTVCRPP